MICQSCINRLYVSWDFKVDFENSEEKLHQTMNSNNISNKEIEENMNLTANRCEVVMDNEHSKNNEKDIQVLQVVSAEKLKNNSNVFKGNGENRKKVIVENFDQILKENYAKLHNNNNNNVSQNNSNKIDISTHKQNRKSRIENESPRRKLFILDTSPILLTYNNVNENNVQCLEEIENTGVNYSNENLNLASSSCQYKTDNIKKEMSSFNSSTSETLETIDLTLSDYEENSCDEITNIVSESSEQSSPEMKTKKINRKNKVVAKEVNKCKYCQKNFSTKIEHHLHMKTHTDTETHCCPICDKMFDLFSNLEMHLKTHVGFDSLKCPKCPKYFSSLSHLNKHEKEHDVQYFDCELCCKRFSSITKLKRHFSLTHSGVNKYFCDVCMKGFTLEIMLEQHKKMHVEEDSYKCNECDLHFPTFDEMIEHNGTHWLFTPFDCDKCGESFTTDLLLKEHKMQLHGTKFMCDLCSTEFDTSIDLKRHKQEHKRIRSLTCRICEKIFTTKLELRNHIKTHFPCDQCSDSFENLRLLSIHKKKHFPSSP